MNKKYSVISVLLDFVRDNKFWAGVLIFGGIFWAATSPLIPYFLGVMVDRIKSIADPQKLMLGLIAAPAIGFVAINFLRTVNYYFFYTALAFCLPRTKFKLILKLFTSLGGQSYRYFESKHSGYLTNKVTNAVNSIEPVVQTLLITLFPQTLLLIIVGVTMAIVNPLFTILTWIWAVVVVIYTYYTAKKSQILSFEFANAGSVVNGKIVDFVTNISNVIYQAALSQEISAIKPVVNDLTEKDRSMQRYLAKVRFTQGSMTALFLALTITGLIYGYRHEWLSVGSFVFIITLLFQLLGLVHNLGVTILDFYKNIGRLQEGLSLLNESFEVTDKPRAKHYPIMRGDIILENVYFQYDSKHKLFERFNLRIPGGKKIGLVGQSGGGKTTLIKLLMRLYDIQSGNIKIDGKEITDYTLASLRRQIALVPQDLTLFHRSIYDNIRYGCGEATEQQVIEASKKSYCHEFIMQLSEQYQTQVGERGVRLSGGQRQRIAIARAMLKNAPILLLDEATSALDSETEENIQAALSNLMKDKTAIVIAHRLSTLKAMDEIVVLENGRIIEQGTQAELLERKGKFHQLWSFQFGGFLQE